MVMRDLDAELRDRSGGEYNLDDVARQLAVDERPVSLERLRELAGTLAGGSVEALSEQRLGME
jgi:predicted metalloprotease with PDZ domain